VLPALRDGGWAPVVVGCCRRHRNISGISGRLMRDPAPVPADRGQVCHDQVCHDQARRR